MSRFGTPTGVGREQIDHRLGDEQRYPEETTGNSHNTGLR